MPLGEDSDLVQLAIESREYFQIGVLTVVELLIENSLNW